MTLRKRILIIVGVAISLPVLLFGAAVLYVYANSDVIKEKLLTEVNNKTGIHASIRGEVELSFFKYFPNVALEMKGVEAKGSVDTLQYPLLRADRVYFLANFWDVLHGTWDIKSTSIENGEFSMLRMKNGMVNYQFKGDDSDTSTASFSIGVEKARLKNIRYRLLDEIADVEIDIQVDDASVNGNFTAENLSLHAAGDVFSHAVKIKGIDYADEKQVSFDGSLAVVTGKGSYALNVQRFTVEGNEFAINGTITMDDGNPAFDLAILGKDVALKDIPSLLPVEFAAALDGIKGTGNLQISAEIKGILDSKHNPAVTMNGSVSQASLQIPGMDEKISGLSFKGTFTNGSKHNLSASVLTVRDLNAKIKQGELDGNFTLTNFENPHLKLDMDGVLDLSIANKFLGDSARLKELGGTLDFKNVNYNGRIADLQDMRLIGMQGTVDMRGIEMLFDKQKIQIPEGKLIAYDKTLTIEKLNIKLPASDISLSGKIDQMPGLTAKGENIPKAELTLRTESLDAREILALVNHNGNNAAGKNSKQEPFNFSGNIKVQANHIGYNKFNAYDASGWVTLNGNVIELKDFSCNTVDGMLDFSSTITMLKDRLSTKTHAQGSGINLNEMFAQFENFGQTFINDRQISGKLTFTGDVNADIVNGLLDEKNLSAIVDVTVKQGELINLKSLESLSRFIDMADLRDIKFSTLKNKITISNQTVYIPEMLVESNAINIALSGSQTFSGAVNYSVRLNLFDVLGKKIRKRKDLTEYEQTGEDNFNFYLSLTGTTNNPIVKYDKRGKFKTTQPRDAFTNSEEDGEEQIQESPKGIKEKIIFNNKRKEQEPQKEKQEEPEFIEWDEHP